MPVCVPSRMAWCAKCEMTLETGWMNAWTFLAHHRGPNGGCLGVMIDINRGIYPDWHSRSGEEWTTTNTRSFIQLEYRPE